MIVEYHRPASLEEALVLLARKQPATVPLAGGSALDRSSSEQIEVVDLQDLGLDSIQEQGSSLILGATVTLQKLLVHVDRSLGALAKAIKLETTYNIRQVGSVAGTLVAAGGRSPFATTMLALDAALSIEPGSEVIDLGDLLPQRKGYLQGRLITQVQIPLNVDLAYEYVARTPADQPIVCAALAFWPSGRTRLALGGYGVAPTLAFDGPGSDGLEIAARSAFSGAGDEWATAEYRQEIAGILAGRCLEQLG